MGDQDLELSELEEEAQTEGNSTGEDTDIITEPEIPDLPRSAKDLEAVYDIPVQVSAVLGKSTMEVARLLRLGKGAVVELDRKVGEAIDTTNQTFSLRYNYDDTDTPQPDPNQFSSATVAAFYGSGIYATSAYGSSGFPLERVSVEGSGFVVAFKLEDESAKQSLSLGGCELEYVNGGRR